LSAGRGPDHGCATPDAAAPGPIPRPRAWFASGAAVRHPQIDRSTVDPHPRRIREVGADLDEPGPEVGIQDVEVVHADAALLAEELKPQRLALAVGAGAEDPRKLLAGDDRHDPEAPLALGGVQVRADVVELAVIPA
jgi:hypothetical protein